jgi:hypothetical protein
MIFEPSRSHQGKYEEEKKKKKRKQYGKWGAFKGLSRRNFRLGLEGVLTLILSAGRPNFTWQRLARLNVKHGDFGYLDYVSKHS